MNNTLNNLALLSFKRKARKISKNIEVINGTERFQFESLEDYFVRGLETLIIWSEESGFHQILSDKHTKLFDLVNFPEKYEYDEVYHFGILDFNKTTLYVYRCYDQVPDEKGKMIPYGLQFQVEEYQNNRSFFLQQESEIPFLEQGQMHRL